MAPTLCRLGFDPAVPYRYSLISSGTAGAESAMVRQDFYFFDLWSTNIASQNNPDMGPMGSAAAWNGNSTISGPFYVGGDMRHQLQRRVRGRPAVRVRKRIAEGRSRLRAGARRLQVPDVRARLAVRDPRQREGVQQLPQTGASVGRPRLHGRNARQGPPRVGGQSARRPTTADGSTPTNGEVATAGVPTSYTGAKAAGATSYYKEINGNLTITGATASFGKVTKTAGVATNWDDFAFDTVDDTLYVDGVVFVDGDVTIGAGVQNYKGSGIIVSTGNVLIATGTEFQPVGGDSLAR